ncbi:MAG: hypothetical protein HY270_15060 [Deltaproteobacteria bacterium]|nr:hypothetical protein [Deltaproteobacteria bacterium]
MAKRRQYLLTRTAGLLCLGTQLSLLPSTLHALTLPELVSTAERFDDREVVLNGTASEVHSQSSNYGDLYTTLTIVDQGQEITVFSFGNPKVKPGDRIEVRGVFRRVGHNQRATAPNKIEAWSISHTE